MIELFDLFTEEPSTPLAETPSLVMIDDYSNISDQLTGYSSISSMDLMDAPSNAAVSLVESPISTYDDSIGMPSLAGIADNINDAFYEIKDFLPHPFIGDNSLLESNDFSKNGGFDKVHHLQVVGDVADDMQYVQQQTSQDCSLMAQEQFVHRYIGREIPEDYLEWRASEWGVYSPEAGTNYFGQTMILDHFHIPYTRDSSADIGDIEREIEHDKGILVGVDAREFYEDPTIPPGAGHAVAIVGKGIDPESHETAGFYFTDSNHPGTARFVNIETFENAWTNDMIAIPNPHTEIT